MLLIPPILRHTRIRIYFHGLQTETLKVFSQAFKAGSVDIDTGQFDLALAEFKQLARFPARCSTGIENSAGTAGEQPGHWKLRSCVLHRHVALGKSWQLANGDGLGQAQSLRGAG